MSWSMWNAPSDRDYYGHVGEPEPEELCFSCGAGELQACEESCATNRPADEPAPAAPLFPPRELRYYVLAWEKQEVA